MKRSLCVFLPGMIVSALLAQSPEELFEKAPPHVDQTLRERVKIFYQAHVDGKFRVADTVVHEDSKDAFFVADKSQYRGFEIMKIIYSDNFTKATVVITVDTDFFMPGFGKQAVTVPLTTFWRYDQDEWWWYVKPRSAGVETPFGTMKPGADKNSDSSPWAHLKNMPGVNNIGAQIEVSKTTVYLSPLEASSDEVVVTNHMPGKVKLAFISEPMQGYEAKLDKTELGQGESAKILFHCQARQQKPQHPLRATLRIQPTNHTIPIKVAFSPAPAAPPKSQAQQK